LPILLQCDAWNYGLGAVHSHIMEDCPVGFVSVTLNAAERNYSLLDKEGTTIIIALKKFHKQLYGRCFMIMRDHKPLVSQFGELKKQVPIMASPRIQQWTITLYGTSTRSITKRAEAKAVWTVSQGLCRTTFVPVTQF